MNREDINGIVQEQAEEAIRKLALQGVVAADRVVESILRRDAYWQRPTGGEKLLFIRLFSPVVQREEVYLGNVLFNAFLSKAFARAVANNELGDIELIANDLENYYFLARSKSDIAQMVESFQAEVERSLPDLFFGSQDEERGIYGDMSRMFTFVKSDFEPFPVYVVPEFLATHLEKAVRRELNRLLSSPLFPTRFKTVLATLAFFYGRTSGGTGDAQSFPTFVDHLVNDRNYDGLLKTSDVEKALNISIVNKPAIKQSLDDRSFSTEELRILLSMLAQSFWQSIDGGATKWFMGFLHKSKKFLDFSSSEYISALLADVQIGYHLFSRPVVRESVPCRLCSAGCATIEDRYVATGINSFRFDNQRVRGQAEKVCTKCGLHFYLSQKLLGAEMVSAGGKLPQVPKTGNLIFHYGRHSDQEIKDLARQVDVIWNLLRKYQAAERVRAELAKAVKVLRDKAGLERKADKEQALLKEIEQKELELENAQAVVSESENEFYKLCPWLKELSGSATPLEDPSLDVLASVFTSEPETEQHILGLGMGGYRMILFVLPQVQKPRDAKEHDFAQRRFASSRVSVNALLSFLRELCRCDGPFYYQSLPTLTPEGFQRDTFYVRNERISVKAAQREYEVVTQLAWRLVPKHGREGFVRKVVLAEKFLADPLGTFSAVMRKSPILGQKKGEYKRLKSGYVDDWMAYDLTEYAKFIQQLSQLQEVK